MSAAIEVKSFPEKQVDEDIVASLKYTDQLATGETISAAVFSATVVKGTDASPSGIISGSATISGAVCSNLIIDGVNGVKYLIKCIATTSQSQKLHGLGYLTVTNTVKPK
jgi:hypothetical protein